MMFKTYNVTIRSDGNTNRMALIDTRLWACRVETDSRDERIIVTINRVEIKALDRPVAVYARSRFRKDGMLVFISSSREIADKFGGVELPVTFTVGQEGVTAWPLAVAAEPNPD